jgi:hypothetical protein
MSIEQPAPARRLRPSHLRFDPEPVEQDPERFFDLDEITDPGEQLNRATELAEAFRAAADRAVDYQARAVARLADPRRFDRIKPAEIAERTGWSDAYTEKMVEHGRKLLDEEIH